MRLESTIISADGERLVCEFVLRERNAVILHGAGTSSRQRYYPIAEELYKKGVGVLLFDFSGHGDSTGELKDSSLARRQAQATAIIDRLLPAGPLYLCGFSMGAQTTCDLLPRYEDRVEALLLGCPAIYAADVHDTRFSDPAFTKRLRQDGSWADSDAPGRLAGFEGGTVIAIGDQDEVIPGGVVSLLKAAAQDLTFKEYPGADHKLAAWLGSHPAELEDLVGLLRT